MAIDQGTSSTKALVVTEDGEVIAQAEVSVHPTPVGDGGVEQDPEELFQSVLEAGRAALAAAGVPVSAIGLANQGETVVAWDKISGAATSNAISWQDRRSSSVTDQMSLSAARLQEISGLPLDPYFTAPKLKWLRERSSPSVAVTGIDAWINFRLTGRSMTDVATASRSLLLDLDTRIWSEEAAQYFDIDVASLPEVVDNAGNLAATSSFGPTLPITGLAVDQQAALIGENCLAPGEAKCTYGTGAFLLVSTGPTPRRSANGLSASVAYQIGSEHAYCLDGQVYTAGSAVEWLRSLGLVKGASDLDALIEEASEDDVICVPSLAGLGAPYWRPQAKAHLEGLTLDTRAADIVKAVIKGIACQIAVLVRAAEADLGQTLVSLRVDGGLTQSLALMQFQADLLQVPVELFVSPHATALGVASLARHGLDASYPITSEAPGQGRRFEPSISADQAAQRIARWQAAAERVLATTHVGE